MTPAEILKKVRRIEIRTKRLVNDLFGGEYLSTFKGQGIEFADVREYVPGDDIRSIDWNVTARSENTYIKKFIEERELTVIFAVDISASQFFGSKEKLKSEIAAEITALLAFSAVKNNDKTGLIMCSEDIEKFLPVKKGRNHALRVVREVLSFEPESKKTNINSMLHSLNQTLSRSAVIFLISDFMDKDFEKNLKILSRRHDVIAIHMSDPREKSFPKAGLVELIDNETGKTHLYDTSYGAFQKKLLAQSENHSKKIDYLFKKLGVDKIDINTHESYVEPLAKFFRKREGKA